MSDDSDEEAPAGAPMWMATFADLMSLLMCFFVLILSFSELDVIKYKQIADSMRDAFGVQQKLEFDSIPKGTSIIAQQFSPGKPDPTVLDVIQQETTNQDMNSLRIGNPDAEESDAETVKDLLTEQMQRLMEETQDDADMLRRLLRTEIEAGQVDVENEGRTITVRIREKGSFPSGSSVLDPSFIDVLSRTGDALNQIEGRIAVEGHPDNVPFSNAAYGSNWDLSAKRSVAVAETLLGRSGLAPQRLTVSGFADTRPQASNESWEGRAQNRRVEIVVRQPLEQSQDQLMQEMRQQNPDALDAMDTVGLQN